MIRFYPKPIPQVRGKLLERRLAVSVKKRLYPWSGGTLVGPGKEGIWEQQVHIELLHLLASRTTMYFLTLFFFSDTLIVMVELFHLFFSRIYFL